MSFDVDGGCFAEIRVVSFSGRPALGFYRLQAELELSIRERRREGMPTLRELCGEVFVQGDEGARHYLGRLCPTLAPIEVSVDDRTAQVCLELELGRDRLDALESIRCGRDLAFTLPLRGRLHIGPECHLVSDEQTHEISQGAWHEILEELGYPSTAGPLPPDAHLP